MSVLRYFTVYGPAGRPDMMPFRMVQWISEGRPVSVYGDGQQSRDFTYVDDIARGTVLALKPLGYEVVNLGSDRPVLLMDAIHLVEELTGKTAMLQFLPAFAADVPSTWAEIGRADHLLGWRPHVYLRDGLERLVAWYQGNQQWARDIITTE